MRPFSELSPRVLLTLLAIPAFLVVLAFLYPMGIGIFVALAVLVTLAGGGIVSLQARFRRAGQEERLLRGSALLRAVTGVFVAGFCVLIFLCAPGPYFKDGGELAASAHVLGVPHPTGFPLFCLIAKGFDLFPLGNSFFRFNALSAMMIAAAAACAFLVVGGMVRSQTSRPNGSTVPLALLLVAPVTFLASHAVWLHGTTTEVYALTAAGLSGTVAVFALAARGGDARMLFIGWFFVGLGLGGHVTWPVYGALTGLVATLAPSCRNIRGYRGMLMMILAAVAGASVVLYLPVAAAREPVMNWGNPAGISGLWAHLTGERIRHSFADQVAPFNLDILKVRASIALQVLWRGTGPVWPLAVIGLGWCGRRAPRMGVILGSIIVADVLFAAWINPMGTWDLQTLVSATWAVSILAAAGVAGLWRIVEHPTVKWAVALGVALVVAFQAWMAQADRDMSELHGPREISSRLLSDTPLGSSLLTSSDDLSAVVMALQAVENARPDVLHLVRQHLSDTVYVRRQVQAHNAFDADGRLLDALSSDPFETDGENPSQAMERLLSILEGRGPIFVETGEAGVDRGLRERLVPAFPACVYEGGGIDRDVLVRSVDEAATDALAVELQCDRWGRAYLGGHLRLLAAHAALSGAGDGQSIGILRDAVRLNPDDPKALLNLGILVFHGGHREAGLELLARSVSADSAYVHGWEILARYAALAGRKEIESEARDRLEALTD